MNEFIMFVVRIFIFGGVAIATAYIGLYSTLLAIAFDTLCVVTDFLFHKELVTK